MKTKEKMATDYVDNYLATNEIPFVNAYSRKDWLAGFDACKKLLLDKYFEPRDHYNPHKTLEPSEIEQLGEDDEQN